MAIEVKLDKAEMATLEVIAAMRHTHHLTTRNTRALPGARADGRDEDAIGIYGEYVASLVLDLSYRPVVDDYHTLPGDIGHVGYEVRTSKSKAATHLILNKNDPDEKLFILVRRLDHDLFSVEGYMQAIAGKVDKYWREDVRSASWWIPKDDLHPIEHLMKEAH